MKLLATIASLLATAGLCVAAATPAPAPAAPGPKQPRAPGLTYLYTVNITGGEAAFVGQGPRGFRIVVPIIKGSFSGPKGFKGKVLPMGGDWALVDANGTVTADVRQTFQTDDGAVIQVFETGTTQPDGSLHARLTFETGHEKYYWMNSIVGVGILRLVSDNELTIDAWQMTAP